MATEEIIDPAADARVVVSLGFQGSMPRRVDRLSRMVAQTSTTLINNLMRARTGRGQQVDMSLIECSVGLLANQATYLFTTGHNPPRMGNAHAQVAPYGVFAVSDGHVILAPANDGLFHKLMAVLGLEHLSTDPRFAANGDRTANAKALDAGCLDTLSYVPAFTSFNGWAP